MPDSARFPQSEDATLKALFQVLRGASLHWLGLDLPPIVDLVATELAVVSVQRSEMDCVFRLEDGSYLHLEFQSTPADLTRFLLYDAHLYDRDRAAVRTWVLYTGGIDHAPDRIDADSLAYRVRNVFMASHDGDAVRRRIAGTIEARGTILADEQAALALSVLMKSEGGVFAATVDAMDLARRIPPPSGDFLLGATAALADKFLSDEERTTIREMIAVTNIGREILEEGLQQGLQQGRVQDAREAILDFLDARFGQVPDAARRTVDNTNDLELLRRWRRVVAQASGVEDALRRILN